MNRSETRTLTRFRDDNDSSSNSASLNEISLPVVSPNSSTSKLKNFNPNSFESQLNLDLTPRINNNKPSEPPSPAKKKTQIEPIINNSEQEPFNQSKTCKACMQSVFKKRFITFENGEIICHDCDQKNTPRPARIKSAHMIVCYVCSKTVQGSRYITETNGKIVCEKCEMTGQRCSKCNFLFKKNEQHRLLKNNDQFHFDCFDCAKCNQCIGSEDFYETESGHPMCLSCFEISKLPKCSKCNNYISGAYQMIENQPIHNDCFKCSQCFQFLNTETGYFINSLNQEQICPSCNLKSSAAKCSRCSQLITAEGVSFAEKDFHQTCFKCDLCRNDLIRMKQVYTDQKGEGTYCSTCFINTFAPKCSKCSNPIAPHQMKTKYEEKYFHYECFLCNRCKKTLANKKFFKAGNLLICEACF